MLQTIYDSKNNREWNGLQGNSPRSEPQKCIAAEAIRRQNEGKPPWQWNNVIMISCTCPRCVPYSL